ncbi:hypothetical protein PpBr36_05137 [Pyricularia pennisetigena]|uniref:hypothetical protein n=1 Tax=Pyricularia pennisetigena TaxID=1578925 RepID=UPI00115180EA|nr:hypothetical protein PpBr36_05137 [Pyricularia pennisetigena]TLS26631.1 hypothetical protein PpBr36_05137 [Pyricularia pennisetigena]
MACLISKRNLNWPGRQRPATGNPDAVNKRPRGHVRLKKRVQKLSGNDATDGDEVAVVEKNDDDSWAQCPQPRSI